MAIAFPLGLLMGCFSKAKAMFNPLAVFGAYLPIPALVPLTLSLFGTGEKQKIAFLALAFVIYLLPLIVQAVDNVDDVYLKTASALGANTMQTVRKVLLAVSWPDIYQSSVCVVGIGWSTSSSPRSSISAAVSAESSSSPNAAALANTSTSFCWSPW